MEKNKGDHVFNNLEGMLHDIKRDVDEALNKLRESGAVSPAKVDSLVLEWRRLQRAFTEWSNDRDNHDYGTSNGGDPANSKEYGKWKETFQNGLKSYLNATSSSNTQGYQQCTKCLNTWQEVCIDRIALGDLKNPKKIKWFESTRDKARELLDDLLDFISRLISARKGEFYKKKRPQ